MSLYEDIGAELVEKAVREFYTRAVIDPIIGHFFFNVDVEHLITKQVEFTSRMLGKKDAQVPLTRSLKSVHHALGIRSPHFARRQVLMSQVLEDLKVPEDYKKEWLNLEAQLKSLIVKK